jgi:cation diffusion facilitator family transporter
VELPPEITFARQFRINALVRSSIFGIIVRIGIIAMELAGVLLYGSASLLLDAVATGLDVMASIFLIVCIKFAARPPDENHPFGHGRIEPLAGLQMGILLIAVGAGMFGQQIFEYATVTHTAEIQGLLWLIPLAAMVLLEGTYRMLQKISQKYHSSALAADASHYRIDSLTSLLALIALFLGALFPGSSQVLDHIGAFAIAAVMIVIGFLAARENLNQVIDRSPSPDFFEKVREASKKVQGVLGTEKIRIQLYGPDAHVDIDIEVDPALSVEKAHAISQRTRAAIQKEWPFVRDVTVHIEPFYPNDH